MSIDLTPLETDNICCAVVQKKNTVGVRMNRTVCVKDFEDFAKQNLPKNAFDYYQSGADDEYSLQDNVLSFKR